MKDRVEQLVDAAKLVDGKITEMIQGPETHWELICESQPVLQAALARFGADKIVEELLERTADDSMDTMAGVLSPDERRALEQLLALTKRSEGA